MGIAGLPGAVLVPSPLFVPVARLVLLAYVPFGFMSAALSLPLGLAELGLGGRAAFVVWCTLLAALAG